MLDPVTVVRDPIQRPDEPRHFIVMKFLPHEVTAVGHGRPLARSRRAIRIQEVGYDLYDPSVYFLRGDVDMDALRTAPKRTFCPLKGSRIYFDLVVGDRVFEEAAWSYDEVCDFDPRLATLRNRIAFDTSKVQVTELTVLSDR